MLGDDFGEELPDPNVDFEEIVEKSDVEQTRQSNTDDDVFYN